MYERLTIDALQATYRDIKDRVRRMQRDLRDIDAEIDRRRRARAEAFEIKAAEILRAGDVRVMRADELFPTAGNIASGETVSAPGIADAPTESDA